MSDEIKTTAESTVIEKRPQPHGGALNSRGTPGNRGGRPPHEIRAECRADFDEVRPKLKQIAKSRKAKKADVIRAIDVLGRYGMDRAVSIEDVKACLRATSEEIREFLPPEQAEVLIGRIRPHWLKL